MELLATGVPAFSVAPLDEALWAPDEWEPEAGSTDQPAQVGSGIQQLLGKASHHFFTSNLVLARS